MKLTHALVSLCCAGVIVLTGLPSSAQGAIVYKTANRLVSDLDSGDVDLTDEWGASLAVNLGGAPASDLTVQGITFLTKANFAAAGGAVVSSGVANNAPDTVPTLQGTNSLIMSSPDGNASNDVLTSVDFGGNLAVTFPTIVGARYRAQVFTYEGISPIRSFDVLIDNVLQFEDVTNTFDSSPNQSQFRLLQIDFEATEAFTTLSAGVGGVADGNPAWAAVSLEQVPEPATIGLLATMGVALAGFRCRQWLSCAG